MATYGEKPMIPGGRTLSKMRRGGKATKNNKDKPSKKKTWFEGPELLAVADGKTVGRIGNTKRTDGSWTGRNPYLK